MSYTPRILAFAGSLRKDSFNKKLAAIAAQGAREAGAETTVVDLRDFPLPLFDQDLEAAEGMPAAGRQLKDLFLKHDGLLIASPEYNSSITAPLKNALDWVSRPSAAGEPGLTAYAGKTAAIVAASPGALGGLRGLVHLRSILGNIQVLVLPDQIAIVKAHEAFGDDGLLKDAKQQAAVLAIGAKLAATIAKLKA
ncbi:MAG: NAD(P)H-dependent oxidoreductase [Planctomycetia bacterium]|nr:NAD(P)H-dependent oxidoreductase [Planctomycetia bacterium]